MGCVFEGVDEPCCCRSLRVVPAGGGQMDGRGSIKELFPTGKQLEPLVAPLADGKVAVGQDDLTVVLNEEGVCTQKCALNWTDIPIAMGKAERRGRRRAVVT